jgi:hypothetical protein
MNLNYKKNERHSSRAEWGHNATRVSLLGVVTCCHVSRYKPLLTTGFGKWKTDTFGTRCTPPRCRPVASQWPMVTGKSQCVYINHLGICLACCSGSVLGYINNALQLLVLESIENARYKGHHGCGRSVILARAC